MIVGLVKALWARKRYLVLWVLCWLVPSILLSGCVDIRMHTWTDKDPVMNPRPVNLDIAPAWAGVEVKEKRERDNK